MGLLQFISEPVLFVVLLISLIFSLCFHEYSHGITAYYLGDDTAYNYGRLTLNPLAHLDPMGTMLILFIGVGYAKPVPVNVNNLNNPKSDIIKVAAAGPISNLILAFVGMFAFQLLTPDTNSVYYIFLQIFIHINIALALFNLLPIYPLDGGQIFGNIIHKYSPKAANNLLIYGPKVLLVAILLGLFTGVSIIWFFIEPVKNLVLYIFNFIILFILKIFNL
tara:strand:+ start:340 stop:1002 length:663 start_codon:yes stop_codon:yes gene_type:complete